MPSRLHTTVLALDAGKLKEVDPRNVESLYSLWTMFNQCSDSLKDGRRLENLSWRLWARETLCCPPQPEKAIVPRLDNSWQNQVPELSNSVASDDEEEEILKEGDKKEGNESTSEPQYRHHLHSCMGDETALSKSRGHETHLSADTLKKIVIAIQAKDELGPLSPSLEASLPPLRDIPSATDSAVTEPEARCGNQMRESTESCVSRTTVATESTNVSGSSDHRSSDTSVSSDGLIRSGSVVHGFSPASASFRAKAMQGMPMPMPPPSKSTPQTQPAKRPNMFQLGASSEEEESSFEAKTPGFGPPRTTATTTAAAAAAATAAKTTTTAAAAAAAAAATTSTSKPQPPRPLEKKTTSFRDIVEQRRRDLQAGDDEGAIASSDEEDYESAIGEEEDDDDDDVWEDSPSDDDKPVPAEKYQFQRVESRANMVSRPSMLSMQLEQKQRALSMQNENSRSQPAFQRTTRTSLPNGPTLATSPEDQEEDGGLVMQSSKAKSRPIIISQVKPQATASQAHSPRTTRRNMLASELGESLRKNLLWERQQKSQTVNAFLKRSRNAQSLANLQGAGATAPCPPHWNNRQSWNNEFENPWEFNAKGW